MKIMLNNLLDNYISSAAYNSLRLHAMHYKIVQYTGLLPRI